MSLAYVKLDITNTIPLLNCREVVRCRVRAAGAVVLDGIRKNVFFGACGGPCGLTRTELGVVCLFLEVLRGVAEPATTCTI